MRPLAAIIISVALMSVSCSKGASFTPDRDTSAEPDAEVVAALADASLRVEWPDGSLAYDAAGVIFGKTADGVLYAVDITTGQRVDFNPDKATLIIDNATFDITDTALAQDKDGIKWYTATALYPQQGRFVFVTKY